MVGMFHQGTEIERGLPQRRARSFERDHRRSSDRVAASFSEQNLFKSRMGIGESTWSIIPVAHLIGRERDERNVAGKPNSRKATIRSVSLC
jgi:hypothetical protein